MRESAKELKFRVGDNIIKVIEIGVCAGKNAQELHDNFRISDFYLIDWWQSTYSEHVMDWFKETHKRFNEDKRVTIICNNSLNISNLFLDESMDYIYLDGSHNPDHVFAEMVHYFPKVKKGGMLAGHDYRENAPKRVKYAVEKFKRIYKAKYDFRMNENDKVGDWWCWK